MSAALFAAYSNHWWSMPAPIPLRGVCQNAEPGTYGHECGKPAVWAGEKPSKDTEAGVWLGCYCDDCKQHGYEARTVQRWIRVVPA